MSIEWRAATAQHIGGRAAQEDDCAVHAGDGALLCILADGMGGHAAGAMAAKLSVRNFLRVARDGGSPRANTFIEALNAANDSIARYVGEHPESRGMGATLVGVDIEDETLRWISVGDSALYHLSAGGFQRVNADHSMAGRLAFAVQNGEMSPEEARNSPSRHLLLSAVTGDHISKIDVNLRGRPVAAGDVVIIASDGLDTLEPAEIADIAGRDPLASAETICRSLIDAVIGRGLAGQDNTTVIVARAHAPQPGDDITTRPIRADNGGEA